MKFRVFLRDVVGGRRHADRLHLFRKFILQEWAADEAFRGGHRTVEDRKRAAEQKVAGLIEKWNREGIEGNECLWLKAGFTKWRPANRIQQRKDASKKRWLKEKSKKPLDPPAKPQN